MHIQSTCICGQRLPQLQSHFQSSHCFHNLQIIQEKMPTNPSIGCEHRPFIECVDQSPECAKMGYLCENDAYRETLNRKCPLTCNYCGSLQFSIEYLPGEMSTTI